MPPSHLSPGSSPEANAVRYGNSMRTGGFEAAVGFHKEFEQYYNRSSNAMAAPAHDAANADSTADDPHWTPPPCVGSFARIRAKVFFALQAPTEVFCRL